MSILKIVFTGGPSGGKTKALYRTRDYLISKGYNVVVVEEAATKVINSGIRPFGDEKVPVIDFQRCVLRLQLELEKEAMEEANKWTQTFLLHLWLKLQLNQLHLLHR